MYNTNGQVWLYQTTNDTGTQLCTSMYRPFISAPKYHTYTKAGGFNRKSTLPPPSAESCRKHRRSFRQATIARRQSKEDGGIGMAAGTPPNDSQARSDLPLQHLHLGSPKLTWCANKRLSALQDCDNAGRSTRDRRRKAQHRCGGGEKGGQSERWVPSRRTPTGVWQ